MRAPLRLIVTGVAVGLTIALVAAWASGTLGGSAGLQADMDALAAHAPPTATRTAAAESPEPRDTATPEPTPTSTATPTPTPTPVQTLPPSVLTARLDTLLADPAVPAERVALSVIDENERIVYAHRTDAAMTPASLQKMLVTAAALATMDPDFRFTTQVRATGQVDADGRVDGDLVLVGGGDPVLGTEVFAKEVDTRRPRTPLEDLVAQVRDAGVRRVEGRVVGDASFLPHDPEPSGWPERYYTQGNTAPSSGLTIDAGRRLFVEDDRLHSAVSDDPAETAAAALLHRLEEEGITVAGGHAVSHNGTSAPYQLASVSSPPLHELLTYTMQRSDNHLADTIHRTVGWVHGDGTWPGAAKATLDALAPLDLDRSSLAIADGSGLSRANRVSASALTTLDARMRRSSARDVWERSMAVTGESGTLRQRLRGTVAESRVQGKTGSLADVRALAGTVQGPDGTRYHFALMGDDLDAEGVAAVRALQDDVVLSLAGDLYGCEWVLATPDPDEDEDEDAEPGLTLACPSS